jgi:hypothetical protein
MMHRYFHKLSGHGAIVVEGTLYWCGSGDIHTGHRHVGWLRGHVGNRLNHHPIEADAFIIMIPNFWSVGVSKVIRYLATYSTSTVFGSYETAASHYLLEWKGKHLEIYPKAINLVGDWNPITPYSRDRIRYFTWETYQ